MVPELYLLKKVKREGAQWAYRLLFRAYDSVTIASLYVLSSRRCPGGRSLGIQTADF